MNNDKSPSGLSIAALVTGILGMTFIPIILGAVDLNRIKNGLASPKGRGMDIAGIVLGAIAIVVSVIIGFILLSVGIGALIWTQA